ncbi:MAG: hypothetical protein ACYCZ0_03900 [Minisyncoccota bacterium]|jgi:hypothetical protein
MAKTFFKDGKWTDSTKEVVVVVCTCGNKYIKTREGQSECLSCVGVRLRG